MASTELRQIIGGGALTIKNRWRRPRILGGVVQPSQRSRPTFIVGHTVITI